MRDEGGGEATLAAGSRLGPYRVVAALGAGAMGEVWRATDTRLGREVALKLLPADFAADEERHARLEREARLLASLNHPNIATLYGLEHLEGQHVLVMELVGGEGLDERLARGPIPLDETIAIALQIASALEAAHEHGIVHRDLKPANVMVTDDGTVKVLDFGLATTRSGRSPEPGLSVSPTLSRETTLEGTILGTAAYMSPEQARGRRTDRRADIWAFGAMLWEMLTGQALFAGETVIDVMAAVIDSEPDWSRLPAGCPAALTAVLRRCLEKDPARRMRDAGDVALELGEALAGERAPAAAPPRGRPWLPWAGAGAVALAAALFAILRGSGAVAPPPTVSVSPLTQTGGLEVQPTISPDGKLVAYASRATGNWDIYLVRAGGGTGIDLTADSPADDLEPAFSPDGEEIAFRSERDGGGLFVMGATGESVRRLTSFGYNPSWSPGGRRIVFSTESVTEYPDAREGLASLWTVDVSTGRTARVPDDLDAVQPAWSPHGGRIAFWGLPANSGQRDIWTVAVDGSHAVRVTADPDLDWSPAWSPDGRFLYFSSDRGGSLNLWRVGIDESTGRVTSRPQAVTVPSRWCGQEAFAADGTTMVYTALDRRANAERVAFDARALRVEGTPEAVTRGTVVYAEAAPSPDGSRLALTTEGRREDLYILGVADHVLRRLTDDPAKDRGPAWTPDGRRVAWYSDRSGRYEIWWIRPDGSGLQQVTSGGEFIDQPVFSPDGSRFASVDAREPVVVSLTAGLPTAAVEDLPSYGANEYFWPTSWSPDGLLLAGEGWSASRGAPLPGVVIYSLAGRTYRTVGRFVPPGGSSARRRSGSPTAATSSWAPRPT